MVFIKKKPVLLTPLPSLATILEPIPPALAASSTAGPSSANGISEPAPLPSDGKNDEEQMDKLISAFKGDFPGVMGTAAVKLKKGKRESLAAGSNGSKANGHDGDSASVAGPSSNGVSNPEPISWKSWDRECFYIPETGEIFTDYESFLARVTFYQESMFQCEVSSKTSMNFYDAQISEQRETRQLHTRFIRPLKRAILRSIQFQIEGKLDSVVDRIFERFSNRFFDEERVFVDVEGDKYLAKIVKTFPPKTLASKPRQSLAPNGTSSPSPHMHASDFNLTNEEVLKKDDPMKYFYNVRLIEEGAEEGNVAEYRSASGSGAGVEEGEGESWGGSTMEVQADKISRDKVNFSKANLKRFLANCVVRDTSLYSPWLLRHSVAVRYGMPREMPEEVRLRIWQFKEKQMEKRRKDREERLHQEEVVVEEEKPKTKKQLAAEERRLKEEKEREEKERGKEKEKEEPPKKPMKFPAEDLLVKYNPDKDGPEGRILARPALKKDLPFGDDFERFLMSWSFLNVMGKPLGLSPFSLDDFEQALYHNDPWTSPTPLMMEINAVLLNCLITDFNTTNEAVRPLSLTGSTEENDTDYWEGKKGATAETLRPAATDLVQRWKGDTLKADNKRKSWEDALVGCLWERATLDTFPSYLDIILHLTFEDKPAPTRPTWSTGPPNSTSALGLIPAKPEKRYSSLHHLQKLQIIVFLTELASQTAVVRDFMDESVNALTEVRKEQVEVKREWKRLVAERDALDPKKNKALEGDVDGDGDVSMDGPAKDERATSPDASLNGLPHGISTGDHDELDSSIAPLDETDSLSDVESHDPGANGAAEAHRETAASRRRAMQEKAAEREAEEAIRTAKATAEKAKRREGQQLTAERKKISDEIAVLSHKLRSLEYDFRSHIYTLRNRPMGYDRFGNAVWWFDGLGSAPLFNENGKAQLGTGRLYLQGSDANEVEQLCGPAEVSEQEVKQRKKAEEGETKLGSGEWAMYDDPEQLHQFLTWLNPRGIRELALLKQLNHWIPELEAGMRKRRLVAGVDADPAGDEPAVKRSRPVRRAVGAGGANGDEGGGGYMAWRNRRA